MSNYIYGLNPTKYGGKQHDFLAQSNLVIDTAVDNFCLAVKEGKDLTKLFYNTMELFGDTRHEIAKLHHTDDAFRFGKRRDQCGEGELSKFYMCGMTPLYDPYHAYNPPVIEMMQKHLKKMKHTNKEFQQVELKVAGEKCLDRNFSMDFSILTYDELKKWNTVNYEKYEELCQLCGVAKTVKESASVEDLLNGLCENMKLMEILKKKSPANYKKLKLNGLMSNMYGIRPKNKKSDWALVTLRLEINGQMFALSQYLTWMYRDYIKDPVERMKDRSVVAIVHQDPFLIEPMLKDISKVFKAALEWNGQDVKELINTVALFEYEFVHCMPHYRGDGAIAEWFERAIFRYHHYEVNYDQNKMVTFEAYTSTLKDFVEKYGKLVNITKI